MAQEISENADRIYGISLMLFFGLMEFVIFIIIMIYAVPNTQGIWLILSLTGAIFFGAASFFFFAYCLPPRSIDKYRRTDGSYVLLRSPLINVVHGVLLIYTVIILPAAALCMVALVPLAIINGEAISLPPLNQISLWDMYEAYDNIHGLIFVVIPLLIAFPWLYPKFLKIARRSIGAMFKDTGLRLDASGLSILGGHARTIPWRWITDVGCSVHGYTDVLVLQGTPELSQFEIKIDRRIPKEIRKEFEWTKSGIPMKLEFLRVRAPELADVIRKEFLLNRSA